ncbi:hypothetical protein [Granulosicoccus antarcticus]|uniref:hypothetical protein n=1 Tax=Granulosicoccus antarcticus TaxID=437505 RepID=UPI000B5A9F4A|nr:hypothetical protein [Granulosicoccus antarcticus]
MRQHTYARAWTSKESEQNVGQCGTVAFAGILTLPIALSAGQVFVERDLVILIAMGVIVLSLITAAITLFLKIGAIFPPYDTSKNAERRSIFLMRRQKTAGSVLARRLVRELDPLEVHCLPAHIRGAIKRASSLYSHTANVCAPHKDVFGACCQNSWRKR